MTNRIQDFRRLGPAVADVIAAIAHTIATVSNPLQSERNRTMTGQELKSLRTVIDFLWRDEQKHFEDMKAAGDDPGDHIFQHLETLRRYLAHERAADVSPFI